MHCAKALLLLFNVIFWFSGLSIIWIGIWMQTDLQQFFKISIAYSRLVPYILVITGILILLTATLACTCIVKGNPPLLLMYAGLLVAILFIELALAASMYSYKDRLGKGFEEGLRYDIENYRLSKESEKLLSNAQQKLQCCGVISYKDWKDKNFNMNVPLSCCIASKENCDPSNRKFLYTEGCLSKLMYFLNSNMSTIGNILSALAFFPLFGTCISCYLAANIKKSKYEPIIG
ncbi:tetraspanin-6-like [Condylostylus longicornis]|uniref:tetraspanin-6-like n=1 Tax=Condylostylus longicornis TaxID=2530218 RepID=UPI00244E5107|nr:tetraspanin-6-like [Condylostylus longicornis]